MWLIAAASPALAQTGERILDYAFYQVAAINGYDSIGHYLRARLIVNTCSSYYTTPVEGCSARFASSPSSSASAASAAGSDPMLRRTAAALQGKDPDSVAALPQMTATPQPQKKQKQADYYRCFVTDDESGGMVTPKPKRSGNAKR